MTGSLGFATDLAVLRRQGSTVERGDGRVVVRTPSNPDFRWGNFVLGTASDPPERLAALHAAAFPDARFTTVGIDDAEPVVDEDRWRRAGFTAERSTVLTAPPPLLSVPGGGPPVHELRDDDWGAAVDLDAAEFGEPDFLRRRYAARRVAVAAGSAVWMGAAVGGRLVAVAGVIDAGGGDARFQDVLTAAEHRRRGVATALLAALGRAAADRFGTERLVIVADPDGPAIALYRRLGFRVAEQQLQLERIHGDVGTPA